MIIRNTLPNTELKTSDFAYDLPEERIAQVPIEPRDASRLMVLDRQAQTVTHKHFYDILDYLEPGDTLVINDSRVIPARILGKKINADGSDGAECEVLLLRQHEQDVWEALVRPGRRLKVGAKIDFHGILTGEIIELVEDGNRKLRFTYDPAKFTNIYEVLNKIGSMPLPPYITEKLTDNERYQTVYSKIEGSAAAPTAGLHFTEELLAKIREKGVAIVPVMLDVGLGTFRPVKEENITDHIMHTEYISVTREAAETINARRAAGGRTIAVGTTSCRTLESASDEDGTVHEIHGDTGIFIYPGYRFKAVDALITNFHLPESTLLMLVSALAGKEFIMNAYRTAVEEKYRVFSFGDAMFIK